MNHETVLLNEAIEALVTKDEGLFIDGTFGRGGHSRLLLQKLSKASRLWVVDKDPMAIEQANELAEADSRVRVCHGSFADLGGLLQSEDLFGSVQGILLDLGVSSPQLDNPERGFSFLRDGPLDMRMDTSRGESAANWLARVAEADLVWVLKTYGEEKFAKRIARSILSEREKQAIETTGRLAKIVADANPAWEKGKHPATRSFQAIRIQVNGELDDLRQLLDDSINLLALGGRLVVISFHSLEDRIVKNFIRFHEQGGNIPARLPLMESQISRPLRAIGKPIKASEVEVKDNVRSRSAIMRVAEKTSG